MVNIFEEPQDEDGALLRDFVRNIFDLASVSVEWSTVPLGHVDPETGKKETCYSGVLIAIAEMKFLITAAHHMKEFCGDGKILHVLKPEKRAASIPLFKEIFWGPQDSRLDVCVCRLQPETDEKMGEGFRYLRLNQLISRNKYDHASAGYLILGYPNAMTVSDGEGGNRSDVWKYFTGLFHGDVSKVENYDPNIHLLIEYERVTFNREGEVVHPYGLSGGGVFAIGHSGKYQPITQDEFKLAGIQVAWHRQEQYAKVVWIDIVLQILWNQYSDTRNPMRFHGIEF